MAPSVCPANEAMRSSTGERARGSLLTQVGTDLAVCVQVCVLGDAHAGLGRHLPERLLPFCLLSPSRGQLPTYFVLTTVLCISFWCSSSTCLCLRASQTQRSNGPSSEGQGAIQVARGSLHGIILWEEATSGCRWPVVVPTTRAASTVYPPAHLVWEMLVHFRDILLWQPLLRVSFMYGASPDSGLCS